MIRTIAALLSAMMLTACATPPPAGDATPPDGVIDDSGLD